ncbi:MAG: hypothetical protein HQL82_11485 [Magnetococcales bacterium]|nr:hypothetical protein [Magnetococcales bacterium]
MAAPEAAAPAADETSKLEAQCRGYAMEDKIPQEEMEAYIASCIRDFQAPMNDAMEPDMAGQEPPAEAAPPR